MSTIPEKRTIIKSRLNLLQITFSEVSYRFIPKEMEFIRWCATELLRNINEFVSDLEAKRERDEMPRDLIGKE